MAELAVSDIGAVIVSHNSASFLPGSIGCLIAAGIHQVVVVDNGSTDASVEIARSVVRSEGGTQLQVVSQANLGFGQGCNEGIRRLGPEVRLVLLLNPDAEISAPSLATLVAYLEENPRCGLVAPRLYRGGTPLTSAGRLPTFFTESHHLLPRQIGRYLPVRRFPATRNASGAVPCVEGACMLARREALSAAGGFDPAYFLYFEEMELAQRLGRTGYETHLCCEAAAEHAVGASTGGASFASRPELEASRLLYLRRWCPPWHARAYRLAARVNWRLRVLARRMPAEERRALLAAQAGRSPSS